MSGAGKSGRRGAGAAGLAGRERVLGGVLLACYLTVLPAAAGRVFGWAELLLGITLERGTRDMLYHAVLFALTLAVFGDFWKRNTLSARPGRILSSLGLGLAAFYGINVLGAKLLRLLPLELANLNDAAVSARLGDSPGNTVLIVVLFAPVVEETLFRGYLFGALRARSRAAAYAVSCLLWALAHVWRYAAGDWTYLLVGLQYAAPGLVMAWTFERSGSLWGSVLLHSALNALAVWSVR